MAENRLERVRGRVHAVCAGLGRAGVVAGVDGRTVVLGVCAVVLAVALGALAGVSMGAWEGVLASLTGLVPPAVLGVMLQRRDCVRDLEGKRAEILRRFAPPSPMSKEEERP
jgi:hypothetical protein